MPTQNSTIRLTVTLALLIVVLLKPAGTAADEPVFKITLKRTDDRIQVTSEDDRVRFDIRSPSGIGSATIERREEQWPQRVVIQLRLNGLESFRLVADKLELELSISSQDGSVRLRKGASPSVPLDAKSDYWIETHLKDSSGAQPKVLPLKQGCIELVLPQQLLEDNPKLLTLKWVDFYRS